MITEIFIFIFTVGLIYYFNSRKPKNFPPGPARYPVIGNLYQLPLEPHKAFMEWGKQYGDVFSLYFGNFPVLVLNDYKSIKEGFSETAFSARPPLLPYKNRAGGAFRGVVFASGDLWQDQRRFIVKHLRDFGFGKQSMEELLLIEINELIENFKKEVGKPMITSNRFNAAVLNGLWSILTGTRYAHDDPCLLNLIKRFTSHFKNKKAIAPFSFFPWVFKLRCAMPWLFGATAVSAAELLKKSTGFMKAAVTEHKNTYDPNSVPRDFIDVYLRKISKTKNENSSFYGEEGEKNLMVVLLDLFVAGTETSSTTLTWVFLLLSLHPEIQEKFFKEIKSVIGMSRMPSLSDRPKMAYTEAVIAEVQRFAAMIPLAAFHYCTEDIVFRGYNIPKDTIVISNLYNALRSPETWGDPDVFRPERFLSEDGTKFIKHEALIPFSTGKRVCLGETLARDELFLFTTCLFQRFRVVTNPDAPPPKIDYYSTTVLIPKPHELVLHDRYEESIED